VISRVDPNVSSVFYESGKYSIHAEKDAIMSVRNPNILKYCKIIVIKLDSNDEIEPAISCPACAKLIQKYHIH
jgi:hypothetical protein